MKCPYFKPSRNNQSWFTRTFTIWAPLSLQPPSSPQHSAVHVPITWSCSPFSRSLVLPRFLTFAQAVSSVKPPPIPPTVPLLRGLPQSSTALLRLQCWAARETRSFLRGGAMSVLLSSIPCPAHTKHVVNVAFVWGHSYRWFRFSSSCKDMERDFLSWRFK